MMNIAIDNLKLLNSEETIFKDNYLISEGNILSFISKNNYDLVLNNKSLEYPIYFTYNHILNFISDDSEIISSLSLNHWTPAPAIKIEPSIA